MTPINNEDIAVHRERIIGIDDRQAAAAHDMALGLDLDEIAKNADVNEATILGWIAHSFGFQARYELYVHLGYERANNLHRACVIDRLELIADSVQDDDGSMPSIPTVKPPSRSVMPPTAHDLLDLEVDRAYGLAVRDATELSIMERTPGDFVPVSREQITYRVVRYHSEALAQIEGDESK